MRKGGEALHIYICPECGAYLDPGERCDCTEERAAEVERQEKLKEEWKRLLVREQDGQLKIAV